jgi:glutathione synthase/RimK-type ligase-like ATP-grasp enzyme
MPKLRIIPCNTSSTSARALRDAIPGSLIINPNSRTYRQRGSHLVLNWGCSNTGCIQAELNHTDKVVVAQDKLRTFQALQNNELIKTPRWTTSKEEALSWGKTIVARTLLRASGGAGIIIWRRGSTTPPPDAPLYTEYLGRREEYRVHIFRAQPIAIQKKLRRREATINYEVRNLANGWIYAQQFNLPADQLLTLKDIANHACLNLGLDFGAVDLAIRQSDGKVYLLEVNTAPGLKGSTLAAYKTAIERLMWSGRS